MIFREYILPAYMPGDFITRSADAFPAKFPKLRKCNRQTTDQTVAPVFYFRTNYKRAQQHDSETASTKRRPTKKNHKIPAPKIYISRAFPPPTPKRDQLISDSSAKPSAVTIREHSDSWRSCGGRVIKTVCKRNHT